MSMEHTLTVRLEIWDGDATQYFMLPMPRTAIMDVVRASFSEGEWMIQGNEGGIPCAGRADSKHEAVLNYLKARLVLLPALTAIESTLAEEEQEWRDIVSVKRDGIRRLAREAREGEIEDGGFAVEDGEGP